MAYLDDAYLRARLGLETYIALFDDDGTFDRSTGAPTALMTAGVDAVIADATASANAWLPDTYDKTTLPFTTAPNQLPELMKRMTWLYAKAGAWERNPDYLAALKLRPDTDGLIAQADKMGQRIQSAILRMYDAPQPKPGNVGGIITAGGPNFMIANPSDAPGTNSNGGDF
jgi:hypothetical protein